MSRKEGTYGRPMTRLPGSTNFEYAGFELGPESTTERRHDPTEVAAAIAKLAENRWELVQIYVSMEPRNALMSTSFISAFYGLFRREKEKDDVATRVG